MDQGPLHRPQAKRSRGDRQRWALRSVRSCGADRRTAGQLETTPGNEGPETADPEEEERHPKMTPVILTLKTAHSSLSLAEDFLRP